MTSGDLIDAKIGKGIEFDGTDDSINVHITKLNATSGLTLWAVKPVLDSTPSQDRLEEYRER